MSDWPKKRPKARFDPAAHLKVRVLYVDGFEPTIHGATSTRRVLVVLFIPSADRVGKTLPNQDEWKRNALEFFGTTYGGATAMPRAEGIWRDDDNDGSLVPDFP